MRSYHRTERNPSDERTEVERNLDHETGHIAAAIALGARVAGWELGGEEDDAAVWFDEESVEREAVISLAGKASEGASLDFKAINSSDEDEHFAFCALQKITARRYPHFDFSDSKIWELMNHMHRRVSEALANPRSRELVGVIKELLEELPCYGRKDTHAVLSRACSEAGIGPLERKRIRELWQNLVDVTEIIDDFIGEARVPRRRPQIVKR